MIYTKKRCKECKQLKVVTNFPEKGIKNCVMTYGNICNECIAKREAKKAAKTTKASTKQMEKKLSQTTDGPFERTCRLCKQTKPISEFYKDRISNGIQRYRKECKECSMKINKENTKIYNARKAELISDLTAQQWLETCDYFDNKCAYCGGPIEEQEHVIPVSKNGGYTKSNIIPSCKRCNASKGGSDMLDWYASMPFFKKSRLQLIINFINEFK